MEQFIFYFLIFVIGTLFGSFFTLAVYRIPLHQNITHKRSYCPNCNHKLSFLDMFPIISYIILGGKCRYCKQKIRIRYLCLEILTGILFLLFAMSLNLSFETLEIHKLLYLLFAILYLSGIIIIAGIDKEKCTIQKSVIIYELIIVALYMVYLYIVGETNIYRYAIYLLILFILLIIENNFLKNKLKNIYALEILELSIIMAIFSSEIVYIYTTILTLLIIAIKVTVNKLLDKTNKVAKKEINYFSNLPVGFYLICSNIFSIIMINWIACRW